MVSLSGKKGVILGVGKLKRQKDFATLIKAFNIVRQSIPSRLLILGEGTLRGDLCKLVDDIGLPQELVLMPGYVSNPYYFMRLSSVFVLS